MKDVIKLIIQYIVRFIGRLFYRKHIWLISDREWEAGDNGEAFFRYLQTQPVNSIFAIQKSSKDYERIKIIGEVVDYDSLKHKFLLCVADVNVSSHDLHMRGHKETPQVFLSHGITYRNTQEYFNSMWHENYHTIVASDREKENIISAPSKVRADQVTVTGYPRYDLLEESKQEKIITLAFTWRSSMWGTSKEEMGNSPYFRVYTSIFENRDLITEVKAHGYKIMIKLHPRMEEYKSLFELPTDVHFWDDDILYRDIVERSSIIITDHSSVVYDAAYLKRPIVYYQPSFDTSENLHIYEYPFKEQGVGTVTQNERELSACIKEYLENGCLQKEEYRNRVDVFFKYHDRNNCKRVYEEIRRILNY